MNILTNGTNAPFGMRHVRGKFEHIFHPFPVQNVSTNMSPIIPAVGTRITSLEVGTFLLSIDSFPFENY